MSFEARCPQCLFLSRQLGRVTPCLLHLVPVQEEACTDLEPKTSAQSEPAYDEPYLFGQVHPTVDRPGPFSLREYVRLQLLRSRLHQEDPGAQARSLSRR